MAEVFVSYSRANRDRIDGLSDALETSGYSVWWDRSLTAGADYAMVIEEQIDAAPCVVVAWSQTARQSLWVRAEANEALDAGKLVQINLDNARLPLPFTMLHFLDFSGWSGDPRRGMLELARIRGSSAGCAANGSTTSRRPRRRRWPASARSRCWAGRRSWSRPWSRWRPGWSRRGACPRRRSAG